MIKIEIDEATAADVRLVLIKEQERYTHDENCTPERIVNVRSVIEMIDSQS